MLNTWIVLIPPFLVVLLASTTRRIFLALLTGIFSALLISSNFSFPVAATSMVKRIWITSELGMLTSWQSFWQASYLFICLFLLLLGVLIATLHLSGGAYAYAHTVMRYLKTKKQAESASLLLSLFFFVDDYFSCLTVGSAMQAITDRFHIPRAKLAVLVNSMAAPLAILVPISSWLADLLGQLRQSGIAPSAQAGTYVLGDPFFVYLETIPFLFYAIMIIAAMWFIVLKQLSFGVMRKHETIAHKTGNLFAGKTPAARRMKELDPKLVVTSSIWDFLIPIIILFTSVKVAILYFGNFWWFGGKNTFVQALQETRINPALFLGIVATLITTIPFLLIRKKLQVKQLPGLFIEGIRLMASSVCVLILIWTLGSLLRSDLAVGSYLAHFLEGTLALPLLPVIFFLSAVFMSAVMGSAWGTFGILIPIGVPMLVSMSGMQTPVSFEHLQLLFPLLGAIISGAVSGNHLSPLADTMLMSSTSAGAYHIDVVKTQGEVTILAVIGAACAFLLAGFMAPIFSLKITTLASLSLGIVVTLGLIWIRAHEKNK